MKTFILSSGALLMIAASSLIMLMYGCTDNKADQPNVTTKIPVWKYNTNEDPYHSTPWVENGKVFVCSFNIDSLTGTVHCISASDGQPVWKTVRKDMFSERSLVVYQDKVIYGGVNAHALNVNDGSHEWDYVNANGLAHYSSPALKDGYVYLNADWFVKLDALSGNKIWEVQDYLGGNTGWAQPVLKNGRIYYGSIFGEAFCVNEGNGAMIWHHMYPCAFFNSPAVSDSNVFIGLNVPFDSIVSLYCCSLDGITQKWTAKLNMILDNMLISGNKIYVGGYLSMYCLNTDDGSEIWKYELPNGACAEPVLAGDKLIIGGCWDLWCLNALTGALLWRYEVPGPNSHGFGGVTVVGDKIYASCSDGNIYCFTID